jgi:ATP-dependent DNA helicase RecG
MDLKTIPIDDLPGTRSQTTKRMKAVGIETFWDLLTYTPYRFEDYRKISPIAQLQEGETVTIQGKVMDTKRVHTRSRITIQKAEITDGTGTIEVTWFNQPYILQMLKIGENVSIAGTVKATKYGGKLSLEPKEYELIQEGKPLKHTAQLVPVYSAKYGLSARTIREKVGIVIDQYLAQTTQEEIEYLPPDFVTDYGILPLRTALTYAHKPQELKQFSQATYRFGFDELFRAQLSSIIVKKQWEQESVGIILQVSKPKIRKQITAFIASLPFELTGAQQKVTEHILVDMEKDHPMNRFVQGDVGSGKTAVAAIAAYTAYLNGYQTLMMAPTEILATQHHATVSKMMATHGLRVGLQTRTHKLPKGESFDIIIGTHALLNEKLQFDKVALVVIDEQHRFGVAQRAMLKEKGINPHLLTMTATPIPRTVALTIYGELDLSVIDEMPKGRLPIKTSVVPEDKRTKAYSWIRQQIQEHGVQAYIIFPLIDESTAETMNSVRAAAKEFEFLKSEPFKDCRVALIHGKLKAKEKDAVMQDFKDKKYDILVSTSVVEVGIDVPNATIMIIEGAERFGLAQLHQLRGRVGRGDKQSYCFLFTSVKANPFNQRLQFFSKTNSGIKLAEYDLETRGPGQMYGMAQSGTGEMQYAEFTDLPLIEKTREAATRFVEEYSLEDYPEMKRRLKHLQVHRITKD